MSIGTVLGFVEHIKRNSFSPFLDTVREPHIGNIWDLEETVRDMSNTYAGKSFVDSYTELVDSASSFAIMDQQNFYLIGRSNDDPDVFVIASREAEDTRNLIPGISPKRRISLNFFHHDDSISMPIYKKELGFEKSRAYSALVNFLADKTNYTNPNNHTKRESFPLARVTCGAFIGFDDVGSRLRVWGHDDRLKPYVMGVYDGICETFEVLA